MKREKLQLHKYPSNTTTENMPSSWYENDNGVYYNQQTNWTGGTSETISQAMSDYIFSVPRQ